MKTIYIAEDGKEFVDELKQKQSQWISVKDQLPPNEELVLCIGKQGGYFLGYTDEYLNPKSGEKYETLYFIVPNARSSRMGTHWMPLPKQPLKEKRL